MFKIVATSSAMACYLWSLCLTRVSLISTLIKEKECNVLEIVELIFGMLHTVSFGTDLVFLVKTVKHVDEAEEFIAFGVSMIVFFG